jgi:two-component system KDP operon response regulator KdpE
MTMKTSRPGKSAAAVLVIDDEVQMRRLLRMVLEGAGYRVWEAADGAEGLREAALRRPDVTVLDLGLPDMPGNDVLRKLREWSSAPVLILSVREDPADKIAALDLGADDYVTKPFESGELLARLRALQRRGHTGEESPAIVVGPLHVDLASHRAAVRGTEVRLTPTEFALLAMLARHAGRVVTQRQILREVWGPQAEERGQYTRVYMTHLRRKLTAAGLTGDQIRTEPGIGYRLVVDH